jgi:hypothetical protein
VSNFWSGVLWAAHVARMGYRWNVGNGVSVRFWEDVWLGTSSLAIQYWELYCTVNEQNKTITELWDGSNLQCTFRRCVDVRLFNLWEELLSIASTIILTNKEDEMVWQFQMCDANLYACYLEITCSTQDSFLSLAGFEK